MEAGLVAARLAHYASATTLFGLSLYPLYAAPPPRLGAWRLAACAVALASAAAWIVLVTLNLAGALDLDGLRTVSLEMGFGRVWLVRLALGVGLLTLLLTRTRRPLMEAGAAGLFLSLIALTGHTQIHEGIARWSHAAADALHLLGAGAWLGGLAGLVLLLRSEAAPAEPVRRFSSMAYWAVGALVASGVVNSAFLVGDLHALTRTPYGRLLAIKLAMFLAMLALAATNRFRLSPRLDAGDLGAGRRLLRHVFLEQGLGLAVLACVAVLGLSQPAVS